MRLVQAPQAKADFHDIYFFISADNPVAAVRVLARLREALDLLQQFPFSGRHRGALGSDVRTFSVSPYILIYSVEDNRLVILRCIHERLMNYFP